MPAVDASVNVHSFDQVVNAAQIYIACTTSILIWDWLSCLPQEWRYIWKSKGWSPIKTLYCVVRYYTFAVLVLTDTWFFASWKQESCARYVKALPGAAVLIDLAIEAVLALRIYALYGCDRRMAAFLLVLMAAFLGVMIAVPILAFDCKYFYTRLPSWPGPCLITGKPSIAGPKFIIAFYAAPMTFDMVVTGMTLYRAIDQHRRGGTSSLMHRMVRDGLFYFFAITSLNLLNVIFFVQGNELIQPINAPMSIQISTVLCCRLILNLRAANDNRMSVKKFSNTRGRWVTDILNNHDTGLDGGPICFSPGAVPPHSPQFDMPVVPLGHGGIRLHLESETHEDNWKETQMESETDITESPV
ncbi:hypothetical protein FB45DRAFT_801682 [Roridomyces roridus]|uniref:DUF6533 domain-containing protein n=1 Tax=Roridomyces roridus TaxID=1738132 RepID=A0AAD7BB81_9AGAR|nr:hypothetical protein FB45DRAFT_801682 [Roridomyces roridus]